RHFHRPEYGIRNFLPYFIDVRIGSNDYLRLLFSVFTVYRNQGLLLSWSHQYAPLLSILLVPFVLSVLKNSCNAPGSKDIFPAATSFLTMLTAKFTSELCDTEYGFCMRPQASKNSKFASSNFALTIVRSTGHSRAWGP